MTLKKKLLWGSNLIFFKYVAWSRNKEHLCKNHVNRSTRLAVIVRKRDGQTTTRTHRRIAERSTLGTEAFALISQLIKTASILLSYRSPKT